jgi:hypothetical protein
MSQTAADVDAAGGGELMVNVTRFRTLRRVNSKSRDVRPIANPWRRHLGRLNDCQVIGCY